MADTLKPFLYNDEFVAYLAQVGTAMPTATDVLGGSVTVDTANDGATPDFVGGAVWRRLGRRGSRQYSEAGISVDPGMESTDAMMVGSTAPQDTRITSSTKLLTLRLADFQLHTLAAIWNFETVTFGASGTSRAAELDMTLPSYRNEAALAVVGQQNIWVDGTARRMVMWMPRAVVAQISTFDLVKGDPAVVEVQFKALEHEISSGVFADMKMMQQIT